LCCALRRADSGGKKKPLKQAKKDQGELDEVCFFRGFFWGG